MTTHPKETSLPAHASGSFAIGGELRVHRLGFGAMRLPGVRGAPRPDAAREVLREAVRLGVDFIDTAHAYGRSEELIAEALHPYPEGLAIATKGGLRRGGDPEIPLEEQFGAIRELRDEGKIRFVGVSEVSVGELRRVRQLLDIATVQNRFNLAEQAATDVLKECEAAAIGFVPWAPIAMGSLAGASRAVSGVAARHEATPAQIALAWLLQKSPVILPIPGTGSPEHLRENVDAALVELSDDDLLALERDGAIDLTGAATS